MSTNKLFILPVSLLALACSSQAEPRTVATGASCSTLADADETLASIYEDGIYKAEPIKERMIRARAAQRDVVMGASLSVRADKDTNAPYMQRVLACHAAGSQAAHANDPLHPASGEVAELSVERSKFGYKIHVRADSKAVGEEIWSRADALGNGSGSVKVEQVAAAPSTDSAL